MPRLVLLTLFLAALPAAAADRPLKVPDGFEVVKVAGPPLVNFPVSADFDDRGRLYVTDMAGPITREAVGQQKALHRVVRLEDADGDGAFDKATVFADGLPFPEGAMFLAGSLYVAAPPKIWKLTDTDDDGKADKREVWFDGKTITGCANDLHGPYRGPDGYVYWAKGAFARQEYTLPNGKKLTTRASHIFRAKPDGTGIEPVMTGGMDNPVDVVFTPGGERIFSTTFFQQPAAGRRDGLVHAVYGGIYGKDHDVIRDPDHKWTSPHLMPVLTHLGPAAPCGLHRYESDQFGPDYRDNLFCCQFNLRTVSRHVLVPKGSTFETKDSPFVTSDDVDFHPTDVLEDADGSLLVLDTGGWYKLCCPSSQLVKADVTGGIYRVRKKGAHKVEDPRGKKVNWDVEVEQLIIRLEDPRVVVRNTAVERLAARGDAAVRALSNLPNAQYDWGIALCRAVAALNKIDTTDARAAVRNYFTSWDEVASTAIHSASLWRDTGSVPLLRERLAKGRPPVRRAAAEALGRIGDPAAVPDILAALADERNDRPLDHSLTYALIEIGDPKATAAGLGHSSPRVKRAALAALDQMPGGKLAAADVLPHLTAADPALRETAWWVAGRHPEWGEQLAAVLAAELAAAGKLLPAARDELAERAAKLAGNKAVQDTLGRLLTESKGADADRLVLRVMARSLLKQLPDGWRSGLARVINSPDHDAVRDAFAVLRAVPEAKGPLSILPHRTDLPDDLTLALYALAAPREPALPEHRAFVLERLDRGRPAAVRAAAVEVLTRADLSANDLTAVAAALKTTGPVELPRLLDLFAKSKDEKVGAALVAALNDPAVHPLVRTEQVKPILDKYPPAVRAEAEKLYAELDRARAGEIGRLEAIVKELPAGDVRRGQVVFNGTKAACVTCHKIGYVGGTVGPDLTRIGGIRTERDLLDSVLFPSAVFVRGYEPVKVSTKDGRDFNGILKKDAPDEVVLVVAADKEVRVARDDIEELKPGTVSVMPAGLDQQLTKQELADLIAFLKACK